MNIKKLLQQLMAMNLIFSLLVLPFNASYAQSSRTPVSGLSSSDDMKLTGLANEFSVGKVPGIVMMKINLWGGVRQPGIYHVPVGTDLVSLISYAGGPTANAELDETRIKRTVENKDQSIPVDIQDLVQGKEGAVNPSLRVNDIVVIPETQPAVSSNTLAVMTLITMVASLALTTTFLIKQ